MRWPRLLGIYTAALVVVGAGFLMLSPERLGEAVAGTLVGIFYDICRREKRREKEMERGKPYIKPSVQRSPHRAPLRPVDQSRGRPS